MTTDYGWKDVTWGKKITSEFLRDLIENPPRVMMFCEQHVEKMFDLPYQRLQELGTIMAVTSDDSNLFNDYSKAEIVEILTHVDVMVSSYAYHLEQYFHNVQLPQNAKRPVFFWCPHAAGPSFYEGSFNTNPSRKVFFSGATSNHYPVRWWLQTSYQPLHKEQMVSMVHPGYGKMVDDQSLVYATKISKQYASISTTMIFRRVVAKTFEIPATGALLVMNDDLLPYMESLGLFNMTHYVAFNGSNPTPVMDWVLDASNFDTIDRIRLQGMIAIRSNHTVHQRTAALDDYFTTGHITYEYPPLHTAHPCPLAGYPNKKKCVEDYQRRVESWKQAKGYKQMPFPLKQNYFKKHIPNIE